MNESATVKITLITQNGKIVAAQHGENLPPDISKVADIGYWRAGLRAGPGQHLQVIDAPESILTATSANELEAALKPHLK